MRILRTSRNAADCLFSTIPKGLRTGCFSLQMRLSHFGAKDGQLHCISTCLRAARYKYLPILKRKIRVNISYQQSRLAPFAICRVGQTLTDHDEQHFEPRDGANSMRYVGWHDKKLTSLDAVGLSADD